MEERNRKRTKEKLCTLNRMRLTLCSYSYPFVFACVCVMGFGLRLCKSLPKEVRQATTIVCLCWFGTRIPSILHMHLRTHTDAIFKLIIEAHAHSHTERQNVFRFSFVRVLSYRRQRQPRQPHTLTHALAFWQREQNHVVKCTKRKYALKITNSRGKRIIRKYRNRWRTLKLEVSEKWKCKFSVVRLCSMFVRVHVSVASVQQQQQRSFVIAYWFLLKLKIYFIVFCVSTMLGRSDAFKCQFRDETESVCVLCCSFPLRQTKIEIENWNCFFFCLVLSGLSRIAKKWKNV